MLGHLPSILLNEDEFEKRKLGDGIYDVENIEFTELHEEAYALAKLRISTYVSDSEFNELLEKEKRTHNYNNLEKNMNKFRSKILLALAFINKYPNYVIASAYQTSGTLLLSKRPKKLSESKEWIDKHSFGTGFNYGSTNIIIDCPKAILILAEND